MRNIHGMATTYRVKEAAALLGVSDDTMRRWLDHGDLPSTRDDSGRLAVDGAALAAFARERGAGPPEVLSGAPRRATVSPGWSPP